MADDKSKKPKIDLKARLGRTTQVGLGMPPTPVPGSVPLEGLPGAPPPTGADGFPQAPLPTTTPAVGSVRPAAPAPKPNIAPPPGLSPGIPLPPFAQQQRPKAEPKQSAAQQTIKVEIGEEIHEERKKARRRAMMAAAAGVVVGLGIGFVAGGSNADGQRFAAAAKGAGLLEKDVKAANDKLKDLDAKITEAQEKFSKKTFPDDLGNALGGLIVPFDSTNLDGKGVAGMNQNLFKRVLAYTSAVESVNKSRESVKNLVGFAKDPITKAWKEETAPVSNFSVLFRTEGKFIVADLVSNVAPFPWKGTDYPDKYKVAAKPADKEVKRWPGGKGDLTSDTFVVPVDPRTTAAFTSEVAIGQLFKALGDIRLKLQGNKDDPNAPDGLLKAGDDLAVELHKASIKQ
jgi:hypothetical protein